MLTVTLVSSTKKILDNIDIAGAYIPTPTGEVGILTQHKPIVGVVSPGLLRIDNGKATEEYAVGGGIYQSDGASVTIMADMVEDGASCESMDLEARKAEAQKLMDEAQGEKGIDMEAFIEAEQAMNKAVALERLAKK